MAIELADRLFRSERTLTIDAATALTRLGAIYAFGVPDLDADSEVAIRAHAAR
jgi:hypothetical protein